MKPSLHWLLTVVCIALIAAQFLAWNRTLLPRDPGQAIAMQAKVEAQNKPVEIANILSILPEKDSQKLRNFSSERASLEPQSQAIANYTINVRLDSHRHELHANATLSWTNQSRHRVSELYFHLYANAFKSAQSIFNRDERSGWFDRSSPRSRGQIDVHSLVVRQHSNVNLWPRAKRANPVEQYDDTDMVVALDAPIEPGQQVDIDLSWTTKLPPIVARMGYQDAFHFVAQWYPKIAKLESNGRFAHFSYDNLSEYYADFGTYDVTIDVAKPFVVGATGKRVSAEIKGDRAIVRYVQQQVHDFAFVASDKLHTMQQQVDGVLVQVLFPPGYQQVAHEQLQAAAFGLGYLQRWLGPYPFETLTLVHPPRSAKNAAGMEYPTLITTGGEWMIPRAVGMMRGVTLHELAHQYFQGIVATDEHNFPFLDEGLATFAQVKAMDAGWNNAGAFAINGWGVSATATLRVGGISAGCDEPIAQATSQFASAFSYSRLVYSRTALVLETLDRVYHGRLSNALGNYARRYRFAHPGPEQLIDEIAKHVGAQAAVAFRAFIFDRGWIDVAVQDLSCRGKRCTLLLVRRGNVRLPVEVKWIHEDGSEKIELWDSEKSTEALQREGETPVISAIVDPQHKLMVDEDLFNNAISRTSLDTPLRTLAMGEFVISLGSLWGGP